MGPGTEMVRINNRGPGEKYEFEAREIVDGGFLELVRYGVRRAGRSDGGGDGEGDGCDPEAGSAAGAGLPPLQPRRLRKPSMDGSPFDGWGQGSCWPLLTGERAHYELAAGRDISALIKTIEGFCSPGGMLPEQVWDEDDLPDCGMRKGQPTGSAMPLVWAHAEYVKLLRSATDKRVFDRIDAVAERYATPRRAGDDRGWRLRPAGGADGCETPAAGGGGGVLRAALERGWLEDGANDAGNRGGLLRLLRRCCTGLRGTGWISRCTGRCAGNGRDGITP